MEKIAANSIYVRVMKSESLSLPKFEVKVSLMGLLMEKFNSTNREEALAWMTKRSAKNDYDKLTLEIISEDQRGFV